MGESAEGLMEEVLQAQNKEEKSSDKEEEEEGKGESIEYGLVCYEELPEYMKENEFIRGYYRAEWPLPLAFLSIFSWHNESINVWTHLAGFVLFLGLTVLHLMSDSPQVADLLGHLPWSISSIAVENASCNQGNFFRAGSHSINLDNPNITTQISPPAASTAVRWPFFVFLGGSMFCLLCSSLCHLLCCHSHRLNLFLNRLDYAGIAVMIITSFFPPIFYIFQCQPHWQLTYLSTITALGLLTVFTLLSPELTRGTFRSYRAFLFVAMGFFGLIPAVHATVANWNEPRRDVTLAYEAAMAAFYLTGTLFYVSRVPERWKPGMFDLTGHSHQIFHVLVIAGALAHYGAALVFLQWRDAVGC